VVEKGPIVGGKRAAMLTGEGDLDPRLAGVADNPAIALLTLSELRTVEGEEGDFVAGIHRLPRYVTDDCTRCNHCSPVCPQAVPSEYDAGLTSRKAIHSPFPQTIPDIYAIDINTCLNMPPNYLPCQRCVDVCDDKAIHFDITPPDPLEVRAAAIILATGYVDDDESERASLAEFGYGQHPDILSSVELQRLLEVPGPSGGFAVRPSDEGYPESALLVLTRVSAGAAWVMANQLRRLAGQDLRLDVVVLSADREDPALEPLTVAAGECRVPLRFGSWVGIDTPPGGKLLPRFAGFPDGERVEQAVDLVVLSSEVHPHPEVPALAEKLGLEIDAQGYLQPSRAGIYLAGGVLGTVGIEAGAEQARAVVQTVLERLRAEEDEVGPVPAGPGRDQLEQLLLALMRLGEKTG
jgi:heterodisulfide reductase subunit A